MVTQIYTAPLKASYVPNGLGMNGTSGVKKKKDELLTADEDSQQGQSQTFSALQEQTQKGVISIQSIITDFNSTMDALGVTQDVRQEVAPYLQVVAHQSQKVQPAPALIKQNLKAAGETLDGFITNALGQKSNVVGEWVDALLLQPIAFHSDTPVSLGPMPQGAIPVFKTGNGPQNAGAAARVVPSFPVSQTNGVTRDDQQFIKTSLQDAKVAAQNNETDKAMGLYQDILNRLKGTEHPEVEGRVLYQMGKLMDKSGKTPEAKGYYDRALQTLSAVHLPAIQAKVNKALGNILQGEGDLAGAAEHLKSALSLDSLNKNDASQSATLNQLGLIHLRQGQFDDAKTVLQDSLGKAQSSNPKILSDVLSNLGAVARQQGKMSQAFTYYKQSIQAAQSQNDREGMRQTLQNVASLYLDAGKPEKAFQALQKALYRV